MKCTILAHEHEAFPEHVPDEYGGAIVARSMGL
jgi:hypothetical protein